MALLNKTVNTYSYFVD